MTIYLATANAGKLAELAELLGRTLSPPPTDFRFPPEDGATYAENALAKARALAKHGSAPAIGDDSGLEVDALGGRPGILSARYAASDAARIAKLLGELRDVRHGRRGARFVCALALVLPDGREVMVHGECAGRIAEAPRGGHGFGYDPIFEPANRDGRTFGELPPAEKSALSHRAKAARLLEKSLSVLGL